MFSLQNDLTGKCFLAALRGVGSRLFFGDASMTDSFLSEEVFKDSQMELEARMGLLQQIAAVLTDAASENLPVGKLERGIKKMDLSNEQVEAFVKYWRTEGPRIQGQLRSKTDWSPRLVKVQWRVDHKTRSKNIADLNDPVAIMEIATTTSSLKFEADPATVQRLLNECANIEERLQAFTQ